MSNWTLDVKETDNGESYIKLNEEILEASGFKEGDSIKWVDNLDGSYTIMHAERMDGYTLTSVFGSSPDRSAKIYQKVGESRSYIIDLLEGNEVLISRKIEDKSENYVEDLAENWIMYYGEFAKK